MKIFLGSDHNGFRLKEDVFNYLKKRGYEVFDVGDNELDPDDDFPQFAQAAAVRVLGEDIKKTADVIIESYFNLWWWSGYVHGCKSLSWH